MRRKLIAVLLISVLSLSSFYAVAAEDDMIRGHKAETAYSAIIDKTIEGAIDTNNGTQYGVASASTRMWGGGYPGVILSVNMDVLDKATGHTLINGPKSDESPAGGDLVRVGWFSFVAPAATVVSTHDASTETFPLSIHIALSWPN